MGKKVRKKRPYVPNDSRCLCSKAHENAFIPLKASSQSLFSINGPTDWEYCTWQAAESQVDGKKGKVGRKIWG